MKARRTHESNTVFGLQGGNEDNDLWVRVQADRRGRVTLSSVWEPTPEERQRIAAGENIELTIFGSAHPPVIVGLSDVELGKAPS